MTKAGGTELDRISAQALVEKYYGFFNAGDAEGMISCLSDDVAHDINQGGRQVGTAEFREFLRHMERCYREQLEGIVVMASDDGTRAAAEFVVHGEYLVADAGLPPAHGQGYVLSAGAFFELDGRAISRVSTYYNLEDWIRQVRQ